MTVIETIKVTYRIIIFVYVTFAEKLLSRVAKHCVFVTRYYKTTAKDNAMVYRKELERIHRELTERYEDLKNEMQKLPEGERKTWTNNQPYEAGDDLQSSGLLGPVSIRVL